MNKNWLNGLALATVVFLLVAGYFRVFPLSPSSPTMSVKVSKSTSVRTLEDRLNGPDLSFLKTSPQILELPKMGQVGVETPITPIQDVTSWLVSPEKLNQLAKQQSLLEELQELIDYQPAGVNADAQMLELTPRNYLEANTNTLNESSPLAPEIYYDIERGTGLSQYEIDELFND